MILSWISRLLSSLLVAALCSTIITVVLDQTVLNSHYLEGQLAATNSYSRLSTALSDQVAKSSGIADPGLGSKISLILTPDILKTKIDSGLDQLQAYYKGNGPVPVIDLTDLAAEARAVGVPVGADSGLTKPITLGSNGRAKQGGSTFTYVRLGSIISALVLGCLLLLVSWRRRDYRPFARVLVSVGVVIGLFALFFGLAPSLLDHAIKFNTASDAFSSVGHDLLRVVAHDLAKRFGIIAAVALVLGFGLRLTIKRLTSAKPKILATATSPSPNLPS